MMARRFGADREKGIATCAEEAAELMEFPHFRDLDEGPRLAFDRLAPLVMALPEAASWSQPDRQALAQVILAKGGLRESDFVHAFDRHKPLRKALLSLARRSK
jgi:hypothetical protein